MARSKTERNGRLEEALAILIQKQASFLSRIAEMDRIGSERFARIESILLDHSRILLEQGRILAEHTRILQALPDAIRDQIGFKTPSQP
jgi:hypothetical protein